jgi:hypothetical protein
MRSRLEMKNFMQNRTVAILPVTLVMAVSLSAGPLAAQSSPTCTPNFFTIPKASRDHEVTNEVYAPSVTTAIYLVNFILLYMANPDIAAYMPAYRAPIPQPVVDCLEQNPTGCPWADYRRYFDEQVFDNRECFWPDVCQENARWASLAPRKVRRREQLNEPLGRRRADQLAHLLGMDERMILTSTEYQCLIGTPPRDPDREIIFRCIYNLTNSNGNAAIPLSSYGLNVTEQGNVRSICAPCSPCLEFNALFGGPLEAIFAQCRCLHKFLRLVAKTPLLQLIEDANPCQMSGEPACLIETTCAGNGR